MSDFTFTPKTEEELNAQQGKKEFKLLPEGTYNFTVLEANPMLSKSNNSMIKLKLDIEGQWVFDYLVNTDEMLFKIKHFCDSVGLEAKYAAGKFDAVDCIGRTGSVKIFLQKGKIKPDCTPDNPEFYPDRNSVRDYIKNHSVEKAPLFNDDIPF